MPSNIDLVVASRAHWGKPYWNKDGTRFGPVHYDCSGHIVASMRECGAGDPGAYVSSTLYLLCRDHGQIVPWSQPPLPGELLFMPDDPRKGIGNAGHVCMVDLNTAMTSEARGTAYGVGSWTIASRHWAPLRGRLPGIDYSGAPASGSTTTRRKTLDMVILIAPNLDKSWSAFLAVGGFIVREFPVQPTGAYGIPQAAIDYAGDVVPIKLASWDEVNLLKKVTALAQVNPNAAQPAPAPGGGPDVNALADKAAAAAQQAVVAGSGAIGQAAAKAVKG